MKRLHRIISMFLILCLLTALSPAGGAEASSSIKIYNYTTGKTLNYTGKQLKYVLNGAVVPFAETPGIIENGYALASYKEIFEDYYKMSCSFNDNTGKLTIKHNNTTIVMKLGSKKATVNGVSKDMGIAPAKVKYMSSGEERILVPTRFTAETLGLNYMYESMVSKVTMQKKTALKYGSESSIYMGTYGRIIYDGEISKNNKAPVISVDGTVMVSAYGLLYADMGMKYTYNSETGNILISKGDIVLNMKLGSTLAFVNDIEVDCQTAPVVTKFSEYDKNILLVPIYFIAKVFGYDYTWDSSSKTGYINTSDKTGAWKESVLNRMVRDSGTMELSISSISDLYNSTPAETYLDLSGAELSDDVLNAAQNINTRSIIMPKTTSNVSYMLNFSRLESSVPNTEAYLFNFSEPVYQVENLGFDENAHLILRIPDSKLSTSFNELKGDLVSSISAGMSETYEYTEIQMLMKSNQLVYDFKLSEDCKQLVVTVYMNYLTDVLFGINNEGIEFVQIGALFPINTDVVNKNNNINLRMEYMINPYGNKYMSTDMSQTINTVNLIKSADNDILMLLKLNDNKEIIYTEAGDNVLTLYISDKLTEEEQVSEEYEQASSWNFINDLVIKMPDGVVFNELTTEDRYLDRQIVVSMPGSHAGFYELNPIINTYEVILDIKIVEKMNDTTDIVITTSVIRGFELEEDESFIKLRIGNPKNFYDKIVVLDAGHGGYDSGAVSKSVYEKNLNFTILNQYMAEHLSGSDIKFYYTRTEDILVNLYERAAFATEAGADFFISLHMNANNSSSVNGTGVYYSTKNTSSKDGLTSKKIAKIFADNLSAAINTKNNGTLTGDFVVVRDTQVPAVLIELAFMTNSSDLKKLTTKSVQKKAAETIYNTIVSLYDVQ